MAGDGGPDDGSIGANAAALITAPCYAGSVGGTSFANFRMLYQKAFADYGASALWSSRPVPNPAPEDALAIVNSLRLEGDLQARFLAEQIEQACRDAAG